ncbi:AsmA-like C-terminal region-containing protein [Rhodopirellula sp. MGV]|uniref:AsmA-like C-terminal region-containing protein n=1 Tax=Rhodopirellula sp. MGV TaxID=2023130 RepID=UPI000B97A46A|nr:AsmA-like C-terminal region-containing protein [Rhodopirellula sp. MGV]OYP34214.1 hypothetical protein CGZ80_15615 [Rhodopirellula sp. MGV]PNY35042.1 hypothetical protein C2E31_20245 [Rhodopirellula baltica]
MRYWSRLFRRVLLVCCIGLIAAFMARNQIVRWAAVRGAEMVLSTRVEVAAVTLNSDRWTIEGLVVEEPGQPGEVQVGFDKLTIVPSLRRGLRDGVWLELVIVDHPQGHLRFDEAGKLISVFPQSNSESQGGEIGVIPVHHVIINDAEFAVHQIGKQSLSVTDVDVHVRCEGNIDARVTIPALFGGSLVAQCKLDAKTFAGTSAVDLLGIKLDSQRIAELPLVPAIVNVEAVNAGLDFQLRSSHPPISENLLDSQVSLTVDLHDIRSQRLGEVCKQVRVAGAFDNRHASLDVMANPFDAQFLIASRVDLQSPDPSATFDLRLSPFELGPLAEDLSKSLAGELPELPPGDLTAAAVIQASAKLVGDQLHFAGQTRCVANEIEIASIALPSAVFEAKIHGDSSINDFAAMSGEATGTVQVSPYQIAAVADRFGVANAKGLLAADASFVVPLESVSQPTAAVIASKLYWKELNAFGFGVDDAAVRCELRDGIAAIRSDVIVVRDVAKDALVELSPSVEAHLVGDKVLTTQLECSVQPTDTLIKQFGLESLTPQGRLSTSLKASCSLSEVTDVAAWQATTQLRLNDLGVVGERISDIDWQVQLQQGEITSTPLVFRWRNATGELLLNGLVDDQSSLDASLAIDGVLLDEIGQLVAKFSDAAIPVQGLAEVDGKVHVTADLKTGAHEIVASGLASLRQASYQGSAVGDADLQWELTPDGVQLQTMSDNCFGGRFSVAAQMNELDWTTTQVQGQFSEIQLPALVALSGQALPSTGLLQGGFQVTSLASLESLAGNAWLGTKQASVQRIPLQLDRATVTVADQRLSSQVDGSVLRGRFTGTASTRLEQLVAFASSSTMEIEKVPVAGRAKLVGLPVDQIVSALRLGPELRSVGGVITGECVREANAFDGRHLCKVSGALEDFRYNGVGLSQICSLDAVVHPERVELNSLQGRFADGRINGSGALTFAGIPSGYFDCVVSRVNLRRATSAVGVNDLSGAATLRLRSRLGPVISGRADVQVDHLVAAGVGVRQATFPVDWSFRPAGMTARWQCRAGRLSLGGGTVRVASEGRYTRSLDTVTSVQIQRVDLAKLMERGSAGSGIVDGDITLRAKHARSIDDIVGTYDFEMSNIEAMEFPILDQLPKMVTLSAPTPGRGQDGAIAYGRIGNGIVHVDEVAVYQSNVQVLVTGKANFNQSLDLDVVASTSSESPTDQLVSLLDSPLMLAAPAPVALIVKANELLKDRVVNVHVGGTASRPVLRLQTGKQLGQNAVKFFLTSSFGSAVTNVSQLKENQRRR